MTKETNNLRGLLQGFRNPSQKYEESIIDEFDEERELTDEELDLVTGGRSYLTDEEMGEIRIKYGYGDVTDVMINYLNGQKARLELLKTNTQSINSEASTKQDESKHM